MRIDSHQHFWHYNPTDYVWMSTGMDALRRDFQPEDLLPLLENLDFQGAIAVQARQMEEETQWLLQLADRNPFIVGVVGWVDFESPQLEESLSTFASHSKLKGVRELIHDMPDQDYAISPVHVEAVRKLERYGLTYDLLLRPQHLRPARQLARLLPNQTFVVDHLAKPEVGKGAQQPWFADIAALAECENVCCKLSGLVTEARGSERNLDSLRPYLDHALDAFGPGRLMIGSDWPVCTLAASYEETMSVVIDFCSQLSIGEQLDIFGNNAAAFYRVSHSSASFAPCN